jgi:hypothetical protein
MLHAHVRPATSASACTSCYIGQGCLLLQVARLLHPGGEDLGVRVHAQQEPGRLPFRYDSNPPMHSSVQRDSLTGCWTGRRGCGTEKELVDANS